jgi:hypothetical protein
VSRAEKVKTNNSVMRLCSVSNNVQVDGTGVGCENAFRIAVLFEIGENTLFEFNNF